jgi:hypothetical protein
MFRKWKDWVGRSKLRLPRRIELELLEAGATASIIGHVVTFTRPDGRIYVTQVPIGAQNAAMRYINRFNERTLKVFTNA